MKHSLTLLTALLLAPLVVVNLPLRAAPAAQSAQLKGYRIVEQSHQFLVVDAHNARVGGFVPFRSDALQADDVVEAQGPNLIRWRRTFLLKPGQAKQRARLVLDFEAAHQSRFALIPGISWDGNRNDPGNVYHGFSHEGTPWSFAWHRTLIPGATYSEGDRHTVGLFAVVSDPRVGLSCSLIPGEASTIHRLIVPEEELPKRVLKRERGLSPGRNNVLELAPGESTTVTAWLVLHPLERPKLGYRHLLDVAWTHNFKETFARHAAGDLWTMGLRFAKESLWDEQAKMFHLALLCNDQRRWSPAGGFSIGWCGRNGELANALLADFQRSGDKASLAMALDCLDAWAKRVIPRPGATNLSATLSADVMRPFLGTWTVTYDNGAVAHLSLFAGGRIGPHPSWGEGTLHATNDGVLACEWSKGQKEQYRLADGRLAVEHRFEGKEYTGQGVASGPLSRFLGLASDANTLSDGATAFLHAYSETMKCGVSRPAYREIGLGLCDAALAMQKPDGRFEGPGCERGAIGAAFIPPLLMAYEMTRKPDYRESAKTALRFYMEMLYRDGCLWGGALDTRSIDRETVLPLLAGAMRLHELTSDRAHLQQAEDAAYYLAAWQFTQSIPNLPGSLMDAIGYDTFGGTTVATVHMCADPYGVSAVPHLLRLARHTGRDIWAQRAAGLWNNASQGISTGTLAVQGLPPRPCGSQDETVNYTDWGYDYLAQGMDRDAPRGAGQCWLTAWPTACRLTILSDPDLRRRVETWTVKPIAQPKERKP